MHDLSLVNHGGEPRVSDIELAERLGFDRPREIRNLIKRHMPELERFGICCTVQQNTGRRGRPPKAYWLNEKQAIYVATQSDAPRAKEVKILVVEVFSAWRQGELVPNTYEDAVLRQADVRAVVPLLQSLHEKVDRVEDKQDRQGADIIELRSEVRAGHGQLETRIDGIVKRRDFPQEVRRQFRLVVRQRYSGQCPCCRKVQIVDDAGHGIQGAINYDHFEGREKNQSQYGWAVCFECNHRLRDADFKRERRPRFVVYQDDLRQIAASVPKQLPSRVASPTISGPKQGSLF